jgi:hypothetical protein
MITGFAPGRPGVAAGEGDLGVAAPAGPVFRTRRASGGVADFGEGNFSERWIGFCPGVEEGEDAAPAADFPTAGDSLGEPTDTRIVSRGEAAV